MASKSIAPHKAVDIRTVAGIIRIRFSSTMPATMTTAPDPHGTAAILQFPTGNVSSVRLLRNMTAQLLQEATKIVPNQQLFDQRRLEASASTRPGHRPLVEATLKFSLTDIALKEIIAGKLTFEEVKEAPAEA